MAEQPTSVRWHVPLRWHVVTVPAIELAETLERLERDFGPPAAVKLVPRSGEAILIAYRYW